VEQEMKTKRFGCHVGDGGSQPFCTTIRDARKGRGDRLHGLRPTNCDGRPAIGCENVREHRSKNRLARAEFLPSWSQWHPDEPDRDPAGKRDSGAEALAFARPYEGSIVVFLDRVKELNRNEGPSVLAHVLVHEITHVLEGVDRHSATGVMKAHWGYGDYVLLRRKPLPFAEEHVHLIYAGLKASLATPAALATRAEVARK
jgi:hypothetical protein